MDFMAPIMIKNVVKHQPGTRSVKMVKAYPVVMCCFNTGAVHCMLSPSYNTEDLLVQLQGFFAIRGVPEKIFTDLGSQISAARKLSETEDGDIDLAKLQAATADKGSSCYC